MPKKTALILSGGGMTCAYSAGAVTALVDKHNFKNPDIAIGSSGGAGTLSYYVSGQYRAIKNIWTNLLGTRKFLNPFRFWRIIDIDYLVDTVFTEREPLCCAAIAGSSIDFYIPFTNVSTGKVIYYNNKESPQVLEALRATKAMPLAYNKTVEINGYRYCDSYLSSSIPLNIKKARDLGAEKILVIDTHTSNDLTNFGLNLWIKMKSKEFRKNYFERKNKEASVDILTGVFYVKPSKKLSISTLNNNIDLLKETFDLGYEDALDEADLRDFLEAD